MIDQAADTANNQHNASKRNYRVLRILVMLHLGALFSPLIAHWNDMETDIFVAWPLRWAYLFVFGALVHFMRFIGRGIKHGSSEESWPAEEVEKHKRSQRWAKYTLVLTVLLLLSARVLPPATRPSVIISTPM